jgi:phosphate transport system protein
MVGSAIIESVETLRQGDLQGARWLVAADRFINEKRFAIEKEALSLIATQQPMAGDLRVLASVLEIATELERIGDYAKGIARICLMIDGQPLIKPLLDIPLMASKARQMLDQALDAFSRRDVELAQAIPEQDAEVDQLYSQVLRELLALILANPRTLDQATYLLWVAHNLERTADRVVNICERVVFTVTGQMVEMGVDGEGAPGIAEPA